MKKIKSSLDPMHKKLLSLGETTSFYRIDATLAIGGIRREKEKTFITRRHQYCKG
jgi:hypothetical protein